MSKRLYVGNLPYSVTDADLVETFSTCGVVESAKVVFDKYNGASKGFGFVEMATDEAAKLAISQYNGADCDGRAIIVNEAKPQTSKESETRPKLHPSFREGRDSLNRRW